MVARLLTGAAVLWWALGPGGTLARAAVPLDPPARAAEAPAAGTAAHHGAKEVPPAEESGSSAAEGLNPVTFHGLTFPGDLTVWTVVVFVVVLLVLWKTAWGPIVSGLAKRETEITGQIDEARQQNEAARQMLADYEKKLATAGDEVRALVEEGQRKAEQLGREMLDATRQEVATERQRAVEQIEAASAAAAKELAQRSATLAVELAGKIVRATLQPKDHAKLIEEAVASFSGRLDEQGKHGR
jgi:F-type H+-transporting ATPase subunit b